MAEAIEKGQFREDLYYRLSTVEIHLPPLRERAEDIHLLFRKFASDFAQKYKMPAVRLSPDAVQMLLKYRWGGNIRQLRNIAEQISVLEQERNISAETLRSYLPDAGSNLPAIVGGKKSESDFSTEREILYKVLFDMRSDITDLKKLTMELMQHGNGPEVQKENQSLINKIYGDESDDDFEEAAPEELENTYEYVQLPAPKRDTATDDKYHFAEEIEEEETLSLQDKELELIKKALERNNGKRKIAARELGISERTLYRKIKQYNL